MAYFKHHVYLNNTRTLHIDSNDSRPESTSTLMTIEEKDSKDVFTIPLASILYVQTEIINVFMRTNNQLEQVIKQDPYNGIVTETKDQMDK